MTTVWSDPEGFAMDWDWQRCLTVWALAGRCSEPQFDGKVLEHELPPRPADEWQAQAAARHWWRTQGPRRGAQRSQGGQAACSMRYSAWVDDLFTRVRAGQ